jgi:hypothetical protein
LLLDCQHHTHSQDDGGDVAYLELGPIQVKRLIKNLQDALKFNGHG